MKEQISITIPVLLILVSGKEPNCNEKVLTIRYLRYSSSTIYYRYTSASVQPAAAYIKDKNNGQYINYHLDCRPDTSLLMTLTQSSEMRWKKRRQLAPSCGEGNNVKKTKIRKVSIKCLTSIEFGCGKKASQNSFVKIM
jgi:hypothetical protein